MIRRKQEGRIYLNPPGVSYAIVAILLGASSLAPSLSMALKLVAEDGIPPTTDWD